ncbi:protein-tyrosine-phosphatase [Gordonia jinghuaiqii]|uniref:Tyrosine-protein phosphatase n=1 Tax=Gordonia jinghuaiqii TaxID=2758710 RepID=A0A7D7LT40_9ACTN|nr:tyrosine-protein phosphatase [Gordonia jinghuaiqii]MCR5980559.1 protein-tyrosine-phosphatase [Gordonia jinghuaiqii]QMT02620.1 tyrosine-protein phosphatase [Gordonia jinghuaiqii]
MTPSTPPTQASADALPRLWSADNFRDLAGTGRGYPAAGGNLRRGVLFRSNRLELNADDLATMSTFGLTAIHDLREPGEVTKHPNVEVPGARWHHHPVPGIPQAEVESLMTAAQTYDAMVVNYQTFVTDPECRAGLSSLLRTIARTPGPQLFHCAAGKDRTGWAAVLLHHIAGVDRAVSLEDYLLTDTYAVNSRQATLDSILEHLGSERVPAYEPAFGCDSRYLDVSYAAADATYGSIDGYLSQGLGLEDADLEAIRVRLVQ